MATAEAMNSVEAREHQDSEITEETSDVDLVVMFREDGNQQAFSKLVDRHMSILVRWLAKKYSGYSKLDLEGIAQETFLGVARNIGSFNSTRNFRTWLYSIAVRKAVDDIRRTYGKHNRINVRLDSDSDDDFINLDTRLDDGAVDVALMQMRRDLILWGLQKIPSQFAEAITCFELGELSYIDASHKLNIPTGTLSSRVYRGHKLLRDVLAPVINDEDSL